MHSNGNPKRWRWIKAALLASWVCVIVLVRFEGVSTRQETAEGRERAVQQLKEDTAEKAEALNRKTDEAFGYLYRELKGVETEVDQVKAATKESE